jgi:broad specificity phosphatase PhoE
VRTIEVRRHSLRDRPDPHLSAAGRALAAAVGRTRGPFRVVVASPLPRAVETAEAMVPGASVERSGVWSDLGDAEALWPRSFAEYHRAIAGSPAVRRRSDRLAREVDRLLLRLDDGDRALIVTHGGFPEMLVGHWGTLESAARFGGPCRCLEGLELTFEDPGRRPRCDVLRLPAEQTRL